MVSLLAFEVPDLRGAALPIWRLRMKFLLRGSYYEVRS